MTLEEINKKFKYQTDTFLGKKIDTWTGLQEINGKLVGDCEDYAITLKNKVNHFKNWNYYYCKLNGEGHCILSDGKYAIDNNTKSVWGLDGFTKHLKITDLKKYSKWQVFIKRAFGYAILFIVKQKRK